MYGLQFEDLVTLYRTTGKKVSHILSFAPSVPSTVCSRPFLSPILTHTQASLFSSALLALLYFSVLKLSPASLVSLLDSAWILPLTVSFYNIPT